MLHSVRLFGFASVLCAGVGCSAEPAEKRPESTVSCAIGTPVGKRVSITGQDVPMLSAPESTAERVVNQKATQVLGRTEYRTLTPEYGVTALCQVPGYVQLSIVEVDGEPVTWETGWVEERYVAGGQSADSKAGLLWNIDGDSDLDASERTMLRSTALRILRDDPNCKAIVYGAQGTKEPHKYYVTCKPEPPAVVYNVWFTQDDARGTAPIRNPEPYGETESRRLCEQAIQARVANPASVDLNRITGYATTAHGNGNRTIVQTFSSRSVQGETVKTEARCLVTPSGEVELTLRAAQ